MKKSKLSYVVLIFGLLIPVLGAAAPFSDIFVLGDSMSDSGNTASVPGTSPRPVPFGSAPPSYYAGGRFTNGPAWVEGLATNFGLSAAPFLKGGTNYAFGGAKTGPLASPPGSAFPPSLSNPAYPPSLSDQSYQLQQTFGGSLPHDALYIIFGGFNDIYSDALPLAASGGDPSPIITNTANNIGGIINDLASAGAVNFLVLNLFDLGRTPQINFVGTPSNAATARSVTIAFNSTLNTVLDDLTNNLTINLIKFDLFNFFESVITNPTSFGFANVTLPCARSSSLCSNPDEFVFWDGVHPTAAFHQALANAATKAIVPTPATIALISLGLAIIASQQRRRRQAV